MKNQEETDHGTENLAIMADVKKRERVIQTIVMNILQVL